MALIADGLSHFAGRNSRSTQRSIGSASETNFVNRSIANLLASAARSQATLRMRSISIRARAPSLSAPAISRR
jgi:hypothetical protein